MWEFVKKIECLTIGETEDCFDIEYDGIPFVANMFSYQEAKAKYDAWKKEKEEIRVGDEVEYEDCKFVVTSEIGNKYHGIHSSNGNLVRFGEGDYCGKDKCKKTGRHFDEVEELLEKMRGEEE